MYEDILNLVDCLSDAEFEKFYSIVYARKRRIEKQNFREVLENENLLNQMCEVYLTNMSEAKGCMAIKNMLQSRGITVSWLDIRDWWKSMKDK